MTPKGRNNIRGMFAGAANAGALAILGLGALRPIFDVTVEFVFSTAFYALVTAIVLWAVAAYIRSKTEDE